MKEFGLKMDLKGARLVHGGLRVDQGSNRLAVRAECLKISTSRGYSQRQFHRKRHIPLNVCPASQPVFQERLVEKGIASGLLGREPIFAHTPSAAPASGPVMSNGAIFNTPYNAELLKP